MTEKTSERCVRQETGWLAGGPLLRVITTRRTTDTFLFISHTTNVLLFKFRCNIFIGVRIIKEITRSVASGPPCTSYQHNTRCCHGFNFQCWNKRTQLPSTTTNSLRNCICVPMPAITWVIHAELLKQTAERVPIVSNGAICRERLKLWNTYLSGVANWECRIAK